MSAQPIPKNLDLHLDLFGKDSAKLQEAAKRQGLYYLDVEPARMTIRAVPEPAEQTDTRREKPLPEPRPFHLSTHGNLYVVGLGW